MNKEFENTQEQKEELENIVKKENLKEQIRYFKNNQFTSRKYEKSSIVVYGD